MLNIVIIGVKGFVGKNLKVDLILMIDYYIFEVY